MYFFMYARTNNKNPAVGPYGTPCAIVVQLDKQF